MFHITQSNRTDVLLDHLIDRYRHASQTTPASAGVLGAAVFSPFIVIVPSMVLGDWLAKAVAQRIGISTLLTTRFWGQYQWQMIQSVLAVDAAYHPDDALVVPEVAVLSGSVMRWRIFGEISTLSADEIQAVLSDDVHPLYLLLSSLYDKDNHALPEHRVWQSAQELANVFVRYLTHRPEWLHAWTTGAPLPTSVKQMIADKDRFADAFGVRDETPEWLITQYEALERLLRYLWQTLFSDVYAYREALEARFWQLLDGARGQAVRDAALGALPKSLQLFTIQQIPQVELDFLKRLSTHLDVYILHFNPSQMFWADIVDANWLATQKIIKPQAVYLKDHGHPLLSRLAKESRETFAMLADLSGGEYYYETANAKAIVNNGKAGKMHKTKANHQPSWRAPKDWQVIWMDDFYAESDDDGLLTQLKNDILMLDDGSGTASWLGLNLTEVLSKSKAESTMRLPDLVSHDASVDRHSHRLPSLSIHACHSLERQLQLARIAIANYLNDATDDTPRSLSDVVVYLPDVEAAKHLIELAFNQGVGSDGLNLPAKITGVTDPAIDALFGVIHGFFSLVGTADARFDHEDVCEWLMMPALYENFGLDFEGANRACDLLISAGFRRGFDHAHIALGLDSHDNDYRYTFSHALDRIVAGYLMPAAADRAVNLLQPFSWRDGVLPEATAPLSGVTLSDAPIVEALCTIHTILNAQRGRYQSVQSAQKWLYLIEHELIQPYFSALKDSVALRAIYEAMNSMAAAIRANKHYQKPNENEQARRDIQLSLQFVLQSIEGLLQSQAVSAEASGAITFARFGALRSVPFGLTIMLEMNLSAFPRQSIQPQMDLMRAGLKRRGDRYSEDDDNGAFLDALLCTRDVCMIFYQGQSMDESVKLLPAAPVSELLEFFKSNVAWHLGDDGSDDKQVQNLKAVLPSLIDPYLVTQHSATAYDKALFYQSADTDAPDTATQSQADNSSSEYSTLNEIDKLRHQLIGQLHAYQDAWRYRLPSAPLWQKMREQLNNADKLASSEVVSLADSTLYETLSIALQANLAGDTEAVDAFISANQLKPTDYSLEALFSSIRRPQRVYLSQKLADWQAEDSLDNNEPRMLDNLDNYALNQQLIHSLATGLFDGQDLADIAVAKFKHIADNDKAQMRAQASLQALYYGDRLPAGAVRTESLAGVFSEMAVLLGGLSALDMDSSGDTLNPALQQAGRQMQALVDELHYSELITKVDGTRINLRLGSHALRLTANLPDASAHQWRQLMPHAAKAEYLLKLWLSHLSWQVARATTEDDVHQGLGISICQFMKTHHSLNALGKKSATLIALAPVPAPEAEWLLAGFMLMALVMRAHPVPLTALSSLTLLAAHAEGTADTLSAYDFSDWLKSGYGYINDQCAHHPDWQLLLGAHDAYEAMQAAAVVVPHLYAGLMASYAALDGQ